MTFPKPDRLRTTRNRPRARLRPTVAATLLALTASTLMVAPLQVAAQPTTGAAAATFNIPAQPLPQALAEFARQSGLQLVYTPDLVQGKQSAGVVGSKDAATALAALLRGTGLQARHLGSTWAIERAPAATSGAETVLPAVRVSASQERETATGPVVGYVAKRSATATKTDTALVEIPQSISVIGREEFEARGTQDLLEAIRYTPGVAVSPFGVDNRGYEFMSVRGFDGAASASYRDGLSQASFSNIVGLTETYGVERIEVLRGPSSMIFGGGDAGGIINRISKLPTGDALREVEVQYGSFDRKQLAFDVGDRVNDDGSLAFRVVGLGLKSNSNNAQYPNGDELKNERFFLAPSLRWRPSAATSMTVLAEVLKNKSADDIWYLSDPDGKRTNLNEGDPNYSQMKQQQTSIGYQFEHQFNEAWTLKQDFRRTQIDNDKHHIYSNWEADGRTLAREAVLNKQKLSQILVDTQVQGKLRLAGVEHAVLLGVDWSRAKGSSTSYLGPAPSLDLFEPAYRVSISDPTGLDEDYTQTTRQIGLYAQDQIKIDARWIVTLGGRQDRVTTKTNDRFNSTDSSQSDSVFNGRTGLTYLVGNGWAPYVSYAESFLPNSGVDADNKPFKPSAGKQVELGLKYQPEGSRALFTAAVFDLRKSNVVTYDNNTGDARQIGKQRSLGLELEAKAELLRGLSATAAYTWLDMKVLESADVTEVGKTPIQVPKQIASIWLDYAMGGGFGLGGGVRYVGSTWNDATNTSSQPSFTLADAALHYDQGPWRFALNASNLLNKKYMASRAYGGYYLGAERSVVFSAKYRW